MKLKVQNHLSQTGHTKDIKTCYNNSRRNVYFSAALAFCTKCRCKSNYRM